VRAGGALATIVVPILVLVWYQSGPGQHGWAQRAGTPTRLMASHRTAAAVAPTVPTSAPSPPRSFSSYASGTVAQLNGANGTVRVVLRLRLAAGPHGALRIDLRGFPSDGGVSLDASGVSFVPATTRAVYYGSVTGLDGNRVAARVTDAAGNRLDLNINLSLDAAAGSASGIVDAVTPAGGDG
jgi:hypothetical protein